jgi:hypothetical protein
VVVTYSKDKATLPSSLEEERVCLGRLLHFYVLLREDARFFVVITYCCERASLRFSGQKITMIFFAPHFFRG